MDKELRKEFRDWKAEMEDRLRRLEADAKSADTSPSKKSAADAATSAKES